MSTPEPGGFTSHKQILTWNGACVRTRSRRFWAACLAGAHTIICHADPLPGFTVRGVDSQFAYGGPATYGWGTAVASTGAGVAVTSLGIFNGGADGLLSPHQVVVWTYPPSVDTTKLADSVLETCTQGWQTPTPAGGAVGHGYVTIYNCSTRSD